MTTFTDGPAAGQTLMLSRAPMLLRVTDNGKTRDALNNLDDTPRADERLYAYVTMKEPGVCHISRLPRSQSGWYAIAESLGIGWGWREDPNQEFHNQVVYVELETGQCSFHAETRGKGPDFEREWAQGSSRETILKFVESLLIADTRIA